MNNLSVLCFVLGNQGGTLHQVARDLDVDRELILEANDAQMQDLCRKAQQIFWAQGGINGLLHKYLGRCVATLKSHYEPENVPETVKAAEHIHRIIAESMPSEFADPNMATGARLGFKRILPGGR